MNEVREQGAGVPATEELRDTIDRLDNAIDNKAWAECRALLADSVNVDLESLTGVPAAVLPADELIAGWESDLAENVITRHMRTNHELAPGAAPPRLRSKLYALTLAPAAAPSVLWADNWHTFVRAGGAWRCSGIRIEVVHRGP